ncbi:MAG: hypothetical protein R6X16_08275, partial [Anaerolineae bacterium]
MLIRKILPGLAAVVILVASGCAGVAGALLINELLDNQAPERTWSGTVSDSNGQPVDGVTESFTPAAPAGPYSRAAPPARDA